MSDDLRQRYAEAIAAVLDKPNGMAYRGTLPDALLAVRDDELERLRVVEVSSVGAHALLADAEAEVERLKAAVAHYDNTICWDTTCHGCAKTLDAAVMETQRAEKAEARYVSAERTIDRVIALAKRMRLSSHPDGAAVDFADRIAEALIGASGSMKRGEAFFVLETVLETAAENARLKAEGACDV